MLHCCVVGAPVTIVCPDEEEEEVITGTDEDTGGEGWPCWDPRLKSGSRKTDSSTKVGMEDDEGDISSVLSPTVEVTSLMGPITEGNEGEETTPPNWFGSKWVMAYREKLKYHVKHKKVFYSPAPG